MGGLSNEIFFESASEKLPNLIVMVVILLLKDAIFTKLVQKCTRLSTQKGRQMKPRSIIT